MPPPSLRYQLRLHPVAPGNAFSTTHAQPAPRLPPTKRARATSASCDAAAPPVARSTPQRRQCPFSASWNRFGGACSHMAAAGCRPGGAGACLARARLGLVHLVGPAFGSTTKQRQQ